MMSGAGYMCNTPKPYTLRVCMNKQRGRQAGGRSLDVDEVLGAGQRQRSRQRVGHTQDTFVCACQRARTGARRSVGATERRGKGAVTAEAEETNSTSCSPCHAACCPPH
jgi:hypothetical protein